ncbi:MAG: phosphate/phosphite/phosphonate ABC transporter substrate-binding protein [Immundisolibacteraceae bacterium]|nr:phosphate/phosphite/phosphonate ABC transporter substrate-binding protein [Immundisolibacteraceae bacterium]
MLQSNRLILLILICASLIGVYLLVQPTQPETNSPTILRVGVGPDQSSTELRSRYSPLIDFIATESHREVELVIASSYGELVELFASGEIDLARFGAFGFITAHQLSDAEPLVMRDIDTRFTSWFLVKKNSSAEKISDLAGLRFSFGNRRSTSGHLMPRYFLDKIHQITPEKYFSSVRYSGPHDQTIYDLINNKVDLVAVNPIIVRKMIEDGRIPKNNLRLIWETPPYTDYVWAVQNTLNETLKTQLRDVFLSLDPVDGEHETILDNLSSSGFLPAGIDQFKLLMKISSTMNLVEDKTQ